MPPHKRSSRCYGRAADRIGDRSIVSQTTKTVNRSAARRCAATHGHPALPSPFRTALAGQSLHGPDRVNGAACGYAIGLHRTTDPAASLEALRQSGQARDPGHPAPDPYAPLPPRSQPPAHLPGSQGTRSPAARLPGRGVRRCGGDVSLRVLVRFERRAGCDWDGLQQ